MSTRARAGAIIGVVVLLAVIVCVVKYGHRCVDFVLIPTGKTVMFVCREYEATR